MNAPKMTLENLQNLFSNIYESGQRPLTPSKICGNEATISHLMEMFKDHPSIVRSTDAALAAYFGLEICVDDDVSEGWVEFRTMDGYIAAKMLVIAR